MEESFCVIFLKPNSLLILPPSDFHRFYFNCEQDLTIFTNLKVEMYQFVSILHNCSGEVKAMFLLPSQQERLSPMDHTFCVIGSWWENFCIWNLVFSSKSYRYSFQILHSSTFLHPRAMTRYCFLSLPCESASCITGKAIPLFICITRSLENRDKATQLRDPATTGLCIMLPLGTQYPCFLALYCYTKTFDPTVIRISNSPPSKRLQVFFQVIDDYDIIIFIIWWVLSPVNWIWMIAEFIYVPIIFFSSKVSR